MNVGDAGDPVSTGLAPDESPPGTDPAGAAPDRGGTTLVDATTDFGPAEAGPGSPAAPPPTMIVPGYVILGVVGRGGMGVVYKARQIWLNRVVALKMILAGDLAGPDDLERFRGEAEAVARLAHPHIIQIHEIGEREGRPFFSMEFAEAGSLVDRLDGTPWPPRDAARLVATLARAVDEAQRRGVVHRDLKPATILLTGDGTPKVADWPGEADPTSTRAGPAPASALLGSPSYMSPEQADRLGR